MEMRFPLGVFDIFLWNAVMAIILLATSEVLDPYYGQTRILIEKSRLKKATLILGVLFLFIVAIRIYEVILTL